MWRRCLRELLREILSLLEGGPIGLVGQPTGESQCTSGSVVAPAASAVICSLVAGVLPAGLYHVAWYAAYGSTAGLDMDFQGRVGNSTLHVFGPPAVVNTNPYVFVESVHLLDGNQALAIRAQTGGVAGSVYKAILIATRIRS